MRAPAVLLALALAASGAAAAPALNPCNYGDIEGPCRLSDGDYRILLPSGRGPHPAVVYLTGSLGQSRAVAEARYFRETVLRRGYALIVPTALDIQYEGGIEGTGWGRRLRAHRHPRDDLAFLARVIRDAATRHFVDPDRLIWAGQSDGGYLVWEIACHRPEMGAAFAAHGASYVGRLPRRCDRPVRLLHAHGRVDEVVPFEGERRIGPVTVSADLRAALALLARTNGCAPEPEAAGRYAGFLRQRWEGCARGAALDLLIHEGGHGWPPAWMPAVIDWAEETEPRLPVARTMRLDGAGAPARLRPPEGGAASRLRPPRQGGAGGRFIAAPR